MERPRRDGVSVEALKEAGLRQNTLRAADGAVLWDGPSAYSDLAALGGGALGIVFENGDATFADRVSFARMELDWLDPPSSSQQ